MTEHRCPKCGQMTALRIPEGGQCESCNARLVWNQWSDGDTKLRITRQEIRQAEEKKRHEKRWHRLKYMVAWSLPAVAIASLAFAVVDFSSYFQSWTGISPAELLSELKALKQRTVAFTALASGIALIGSLWRVQKGFYQKPLLMIFSHTTTVLCLAGLVVSIFGVSARISPSDWKYSVVPPLKNTANDPTSTWEEQLKASIVTVRAPGKAKDMRLGGLGSGIIVGRKKNTALIITCSHVALPLVSAGANRDINEIPPVWVALSTGAGGFANIVWFAPPPVDLALLSLTGVDAVPQPVPVADTTAHLSQGAQVWAVPNPLRKGWMMYRGQIDRWESKDTPAGIYRIVFSNIPVLPGDSGSGLFDEQGRLVGITTWMYKSPMKHQAISLSARALEDIQEQMVEFELHGI